MSAVGEILRLAHYLGSRFGESAIKKIVLSDETFRAVILETFITDRRAPQLPDPNASFLCGLITLTTPKGSFEIVRETMSKNPEDIAMVPGSERDEN